MSWLIIDLEAVGIGSHAAVLAVAWLGSDGVSGWAPVDLDLEFQRCAEAHARTLRWWLQQPAAAWLTERPPLDPVHILDAIRSAYRRLWAPDSAPTIWCRGPAYDLPILRGLAQRHLSRADWEPWRPWDERCIRTAAKMLRYPQPQAEHHPLRDCERDAPVVRAATRFEAWQLAGQPPCRFPDTPCICGLHGWPLQEAQA